MKTIILASANKGKIKEIKEIFSNFDIVSMKDFGIDIDIEETGKTFAENALLKANTIAKMTGYTTLADDSGLCIDALNGDPGIYTHRFCNGDWDKGISILNEKLKDIPQEKRTAYYYTVCGLVLSNGKKYTTDGRMNGIILSKKIGTNGFAFDPVFYVPEYNKTVAELDDAIKNSISHRSIAFRSMEKIIKEIV